MVIGEAKIEDIKQIQIVRNSVNENKLSPPSKVTDKDCAEYLQERGKGWVSVIGHQIVGFFNRRFKGKQYLGFVFTS